METETIKSLILLIIGLIIMGVGMQMSGLTGIPYCLIGGILTGNRLAKLL